jgi:hypothetical protein
MFNFPRYLIFPDKVYIFSVLHQSYVGRAINRDLIDYLVELKNPMDGSDQKKLFLGTANSLVLGYRERVPLEWLLCRFLCDHILSNSLQLLDGNNGEVLNFRNYKKYLGQPTNDAEIKQVLSYIFTSWVRTLPQEKLSWRAIYVSAISIPEENLKKCIDSFRLEDFIGEKLKENGVKERLLVPSVSLSD